MDHMKDIKDRITGTRKAHYASEKFETDAEICGFGLASVDPNLNLEEGRDYYTPTYSHYYITGEGISEEEALQAFWQDYDSQGPYGNGDIFWRITPIMEQHLEKYTVTARFSIK